MVVLYPLDLLRVDWILIALCRVVHETSLKLAHNRCLNQIGAHAYTVVRPQEPFLVDGSLLFFCEWISAAEEPAVLVVVVAGSLRCIFFLVLVVVDKSLVVVVGRNLIKIIETGPGLGELNMLCSPFLGENALLLMDFRHQGSWQAQRVEDAQVVLVELMRREKAFNK